MAEVVDRFKRARKTVRTGFTRAYTTLNENVNQENPIIDDVQVSFQLFESKALELDALNQKIMDAMLDSDMEQQDLDAEYDLTTEYSRKYLRAKIEVAKIVDRVSTQKLLTIDNIGTAQVHGQDSKRRFKLPKIELKKFSGELKDWLQFWSQFKKIHEDKDINDEDKFQYLIQSMTPNSKAAEVVNSFPPTSDNYKKVITSLKGRFGKDDLLVEVYVRELLKLVLNNAMKTNENIPLSSIYDKLESQLRALESLGVTKVKCAAMLYPLVESSLPEDLLRAWQRYASTLNANELRDRLTKLMEFLQAEVENEERITMAVQGFSLNTEQQQPACKMTTRKKSNPEKSTYIPSATALFTAKDNKTTYQCIFCSEGHQSTKCEKAKKMSLEWRQNKVREKKGCFGCLTPGHNVNRCKFHPKCPWCSRTHALLLCRDMPSNQTSEKKTTTESSEKITNEANLANLSVNPEVSLQTLLVKLKNEGRERIVRAVLDSGSQRSYVLKQAINDMKYEPVGEQQVVHLLFGGTRTKPQNHKGYLVHLRSLDDSYACNFIALDQETICQGIPSVDNGPWIQELLLRNIKLTDVERSDEPITILIGADILGKLLTGNLHNLECGITAVETQLGWTLMGKKPREEISRSDTALVVTSMFVQEAEISDLWRLDVLGITDPVQSKSNETCQEEIRDRFRQSVIINENGRYEVRLPWQESHPFLPTNKDIAQKRLLTTTNRLKNQGLYQDYDQVLEEWFKEGIIEKVPELEIDKWGHYLPHRHVLKENSTTRLRPVFDASAITKNGLSLNQCLETGPNLIELIPRMLLRFREKEIGVISDIRKAFLQISISPTDRDALRFLWWNKNKPEVVQIYRHARVVFGVTSSPFLLAAVIALHLELVSGRNDYNIMKNTIEKLSKSFYVDNCVTSIDTEEQVQQFKYEATALMAAGGFDLRGWEFSKCEDPHHLTSVLGLTWDKRDDTLMLKQSSLVELPPTEKVTKRVILAAAHKIFDAIGFTCPVLLRPKLLLQTITDLDWDTEVSLEIKQQFIEWYQQLKFLENLRIPRWIFASHRKESKMSFHVFVDASKVAYAVVIYARTQSTAGVKTQLVEAKSRVAPTKKTTIPRLELLAATIGARLMKFICEALEYEQPEIHFWSDSTTVLSWIHRQNQWATFVWNRIQEIRSLTDSARWRHVPGSMNPADLPSRGCTVKQLLKSRWWEGPEWLKHSPEDWPTTEYSADDTEVYSELKKSVTKMKASTETQRGQYEEDVIMSSRCEKTTKEVYCWYIQYFSKYTKVVRMVGWIQRFVFNAKSSIGSRRSGELSAKEFSDAEMTIIRLVQKESFLGECDPKISSLQAFVDKTDLIRLKTLVFNRKDKNDFRRPVVLDPHHPLVTRLIEHYHNKLQHAGVQTVLNHLRERFWILTGRRAVRGVINRCVVCKRFKVTHVEAAPAILPEERVRDATIFEVTGVDFAGPLYLKDGQKAWICLFTCAVFRAVHLELVTSLSTEAFLEALRRFIARRERPAIIYSDNGTNFTGTKKLFRNINWDKVKKYSAAEKIEWRFNPPLAAWWGGWWERLVRLVKELLRRVLKRSCLSYEEMSTTLCDCEAVINSRPITYLSEDATEPTPLTPDMFLREAKESGVPDIDHIDTTNLQRRLRYRQKLRDCLRRRFRIEYLGQLSRKQSKTGKNAIKVGEVVLVGNDNQKRLDWPLARIIEVIAGKDGEIRVVRLKTATGELVRPVQRIFPLEVTSPVETEVICTSKSSTSSKKKRSLTPVRDDNPTNEIKTEIRTRSGRQVKQPDRFVCENK